ncbi:MAG TPA: methyltransferase domain-containing protein [Vicinamibacterales bacterium]|nr:methyltransferase domain-containing protein [Vicinamibacterales bacterium]
MLKLRKPTSLEPLIVSMTGLRIGDRVLILGAGEPKGLALLAQKPGLSGRVCVVDDDPARTGRAAETAAREGALVEAETAPVTMLPFDAGSFDVVVVNHLLPSLAGDRQIAALNEASRVLRGGGRCIVIQRAPRSGLGALFGRGGQMPPTQVEAALTAASFRGVRTLADRDGLLFVEGARK